MTIDPTVLRILVCPETKLALGTADEALIQSVNDRILKGEVRTTAGAPVDQLLVEALVREDNKILYPVRDGIPIMMVEEALSLE